MGHVEVAHVSHVLPDGQVLLDESADNLDLPSAAALQRGREVRESPDPVWD